MFDLTTDAWRSTLIGNNKTRQDKYTGEISNLIAPSLLTIDAVNEGLKDPNFFNLTRLMKEKQKEKVYESPYGRRQYRPASQSQIDYYNQLKESELDFDITKASGKDALRGSGVVGAADRYAAELLEKGKIALPGYEPRDAIKASMDEAYLERRRYDKGMQEFPQNVINFIGEGNKQLSEYASTAGGKFVGDVASWIFPDQTLIPNTAQDRARWNDRDYQFNKEMEDLKKSKASAKEYLKPIGERVLAGVDEGAGNAAEAGAAIAPLVLPGGVVANIATLGASGLVSGTVAYKASRFVNDNMGYRNLVDFEVPAELQDAYEKYGWALNNLSKMDDKYKDLMPSIDDIAEGNNPGDEWYKKAKETLEKDYDELSAKQKEAKEHGDKLAKPSDEWNRRVNEIGGIYSLPESIGASLTELGLMGASVAASTILYAAAGKVSSMILGVPGKPLLGAYIPAHVLSTGFNAYTSLISRESEFTSQFAEANRAKKNAYLVESKLGPLQSLADSKLLSIADSTNPMTQRYLDEFNKTGKLSKDSKESLSEELLNGRIKSTDDRVTKAIQYGDEGADETARQFMALIFPDMVSTTVAALPFNMKSVSGLLKSEPGLFRNMYDAVDDVANYVTKSKFGAGAMKVLSSKPSKFLLKGAAAKVPEMAQESLFEEVPQFIIEDKYKKNELYNSNSLIGSVFNAYDNAFTGIQGLMGISGDQLYDNNEDLEETFKQAMLMSFVLPTVTTIATGAVIPQTINKINEAGAKKFVKGHVLSQLKNQNRMNKSDAYVYQMSMGKQDRVLNYMEELKKNLPEGVTVADIDKEIKLARKTFAVANNKNVLNYAKNGGGVGSVDHKQLVGLIMSHSDMRKETEELAAGANREFAVSVDKEFEQSNFFSQLEMLNEGRETKLDNAAMRSLYVLKANLEASDYVKFTDNYGSKFSKTKTKIMDTFSKVKSKDIRNDLANGLMLHGLINQDQFESLIKKDITNKDFNEILSSNNILPDTGSAGLGHLVKAQAAVAGAAYDYSMASMLMGVRGGQVIDKK